MRLDPTPAPGLAVLPLLCGAPRPPTLIGPACKEKQREGREEVSVDVRILFQKPKKTNPSGKFKLFSLSAHSGSKRLANHVRACAQLKGLKD